MESVIDRQMAIAAMNNREPEQQAQTEGDALYAAANRTQAGILVGMIEIREAIEEGLQRIDQTSIEAAMMLVGMKETFDKYIELRIGSDKVMEALMVEIHGEDEQIEEKAEPKVDKPKKASVTMDVGNFGGPGIDSGIA